MDKYSFIGGILIFLLVFVMGTFSIALEASMFSAEDSIILDGDDVVSYNIINTDEIEIVTEDDTYIIDLGFDDVVDFTVNSDIHIKLERFDTRIFWWDFIIHSEPVYPDEYRIGRIIKVPNGVE